MNVNKRDRHRELEVYLTTFNGEQHLRLHGWLKRNDVLVKAENIQDNGDQFGVFRKICLIKCKILYLAFKLKIKGIFKNF
jgi:hypothetical protein